MKTDVKAKTNFNPNFLDRRILIRQTAIQLTI